uniref:Uncharacterized protein n=3 Tax=Palpitomonas bilix TaxID=652834 RepID=A0A7S3FXU2_9EUKA|mmetsp:Transcript_11789/g.31774  ORF Transcript_11789/g.31774 Transcript_11789/m.31774 type:complete len:169 (+) Transcript_11789:359-865(+)
MSQASNKLKEKVIEPSILEWLVEMGRQIAEIALNYGEALKQKDQFQMGFAALSGVHDRYIQREHEWAPEHQKKPFFELSVQEQMRDLPVTIAVLYTCLSEHVPKDEIKRKVVDSIVRNSPSPVTQPPPVETDSSKTEKKTDPRVDEKEENTFDAFDTRLWYVVRFLFS